MKIKPIFTPALTKIRQSYIVNQANKKLSPLPNDVVELSPQAKIKLQADKILEHYKKFSIEDYKHLTKLEKTILNEAYSHHKDIAMDSLNIGLNIKERLDKKYGADNYVFCCIGTSPSGIARVLEFTGVETKYLPMSSLRHELTDKQIKDLDKKIGPYKKFLKEQGLSAQEIKDSKKKYIICDYTSTGGSLKNFKKIANRHFHWNLPNVEITSINSLCKTRNPDYIGENYIHKYMSLCKIARWGGVAHLSLEDIKKINECKNYQTKEAKIFNFLLIDELNRLSLLKNNPKNKTSL